MIQATTDKYILKGKIPVPCPDLRTWAKWFEEGDRRRVREKFLAVTWLGFQIDTVHVSTIFLGVNHNWSGIGPPTLFETMIFGGPQDGWQERCSTWEEAEAMHKEALGIARAARRVPFRYVLKRLWNIARRRNGNSRPS